MANGERSGTEFLSLYNDYSIAEVEKVGAVFPNEVIAAAIVQGGALHIRDIENGEEAYHYSSGNFGPGYVSIKNAVGNQKLFKFLVRQLALRAEQHLPFVHGVDGIRFIAGLVTGGVPPSLYLRDHLQRLWKRDLGWCYIRDTRKAGGTREHVTGIAHLATGGVNPEIPVGCEGVLVEELTNYANSITNGAEVLRACGYPCELGLCILDYDQPKGREALAAHGMRLMSLITLPRLLDAVEASGAIPKRLVDDYRYFQQDPEGWMKKYGYTRTEHSR